MKTFSHPSNARRAARAALGKAAKEGVDYELVKIAAGGDAGKAGIGFRELPRTKPAKSNGKRAERPRTMPTPAAKQKSARRQKLDAFAGKPVSLLKAAAGGKRKSKPAKKETSGAWLDQLIAMLQRPEGATAAEVGEAFGWLEHTSRARISVGPRAKHMRAERSREERHGKPVSVYRVSEELPLGQKRNELGVLYVKPQQQPKAKAA